MAISNSVKQCNALLDQNVDIFTDLSSSTENWSEMLSILHKYHAGSSKRRSKSAVEIRRTLRGDPDKPRPVTAESVEKERIKRLNRKLARMTKTMDPAEAASLVEAGVLKVKQTRAGAPTLVLAGQAVDLITCDTCGRLLRGWRHTCPECGDLCGSCFRRHERGPNTKTHPTSTRPLLETIEIPIMPDGVDAVSVLWTPLHDWHLIDAVETLSLGNWDLCAGYVNHMHPPDPTQPVLAEHLARRWDALDAPGPPETEIITVTRADRPAPRGRGRGVAQPVPTPHDAMVADLDPMAVTMADIERTWGITQPSPHSTPGSPHQAPPDPTPWVAHTPSLAAQLTLNGDLTRRLERSCPGLIGLPYPLTRAQPAADGGDVEMIRAAPPTPPLPPPACPRLDLDGEFIEVCLDTAEAETPFRLVAEDGDTPQRPRAGVRKMSGPSLFDRLQGGLAELDCKKKI